MLNGQSQDFDAVDLYSCNGTAAQVWSLESDGTIRALGKCLDDPGATTTDGTQLQIYTCNGTLAQVWRLP